MTCTDILMNMCNTVDLCVLNGRAFNDKGKGKYTFCNKRGKSTIDYVLSSKLALYKIVDFDILPFNSFSDHSALSFSLKTNLNVQSNVETGHRIKVFAKWDEDKKESFLNGINHGDITEKLNELTQKVNVARNGEMLEDSLSDFTNILGAGSFINIV